MKSDALTWEQMFSQLSDPGEAMAMMSDETQAQVTPEFLELCRQDLEAESIPGLSMTLGTHSAKANVEK
ncbi:hypothetical protein H920_20565 [Fukomys damarensis]|uniref:Uncharacterized protein n=1 Tax=Fukomys damarensis TaxID=885580 RepID=A0A091CK59_FUKDA|nr:hypothetical protein H920_20565 [Fukomys damarensis]